MSATFKPTLYLKHACPFSFKLRVFLLEAGLLDAFALREFVSGTDDESDVHRELEPHFEKVSFPTAQIADGTFMNESDTLIAHYAREAGVNPAAMPTFREYVTGPFATIISAYSK